MLLIYNDCFSCNRQLNTDYGQSRSDKFAIRNPKSKNPCKPSSCDPILNLDNIAFKAIIPICTD